MIIEEFKFKIKRKIKGPVTGKDLYLLLPRPLSHFRSNYQGKHKQGQSCP